jgi:Arc/MetJ family transcription regulator
VVRWEDNALARATASTCSWAVERPLVRLADSSFADNRHRLQPHRHPLAVHERLRRSIRERRDRHRHEHPRRGGPDRRVHGRRRDGSGRVQRRSLAAGRAPARHPGVGRKGTEQRDLGRVRRPADIAAEGRRVSRAGVSRRGHRGGRGPSSW